MPAKSTSPRQRALYLDTKRRQAAIAKIKRDPTADVKTTACGLGIGLAVAYREAERLGAHRIGGRWIFPTTKLRDMLGLSAQAAA